MPCTHPLRAKTFVNWSRIRAHSTKAVFKGWREHTQEEKALRMKALKVVQKLKNGAFVGAFERWREHTREEKVCQERGRFEMEL